MATRLQGRPRATTHAAIEEAAFALFENHGFDQTTMDDIAAALGIGRRTLFRYYPSKNDILWGQFDASLRDFENFLASTPKDVPLADALRDAVIAFNSFDDEAMPQHRRRMTLLLGTPALLGHSELRYTAWRDTVARFVADRTYADPDDLAPRVAGRVALALALAAYEEWLASSHADLPETIHRAFDVCAGLLSPRN